MRVWVFSAIAIIILIFAFTLLNRPQTPQTSVSTPVPAPEVENITASFKIMTGNITRSFKDPKYHQKSPDVYISADDPTIVFVHKNGITWDDFFKTLPMKLTKDCLTTGDGETFCNDQNGSLKFYISPQGQEILIEDKDLLDKEIKQNDQILIKFTPK